MTYDRRTRAAESRARTAQDATGGTHRRELTRLRPLGDADAAWLESWLGAVAASVAYEAIDSSQPAASLLRRLGDEPSLRAQIIEREGVDAGIVVYRVHHPRRGAGVFELVGVPDAQARRGSGMMAAGAAERELFGLDVRTIYAPAPEVHGIDVYFWIRLGYRPLQRVEWPCERAGVLWLQRRLEE